MNPQAILLALYGLVQLGQSTIDLMKRREGLTDEDLARLWEEQRADFDAALALWRRSAAVPPGDRNV